MKLVDAIKKLRKVVGQDRFVSVQVELSQHGRSLNPERTVELIWTVYYDGGSHQRAETFKEALRMLIKEFNKSRKSSKPSKLENIEVTGD